MARWTCAILAALLGLAMAQPAQAQWKWRDKNGQTQYSDLPPPQGVPDQDILSRPHAAQRRGAVPVAAAAPASGPVAGASAPRASASGALAARSVEPELEAKRKKAEADQAAKAKLEDLKLAATRAENCTRARTQMRSLDSGLRIARTNEKGEREFLDEKQRADETRRTREVISADCK